MPGGSRTAGPKAPSNASSASSVGSANSEALWSIVDGLGEDVSVWINAADRTIIKSTDKFNACFSVPEPLKIDGPFAETIARLASQGEHADAAVRRCEVPLRLIGKQWGKWSIEFDARGCFEVLPAVDGVVAVKVDITSSGQPALRRQHETPQRTRSRRSRRGVAKGRAKAALESL